MSAQLYLDFQIFGALGKYCTFWMVFRELRVLNIICNKSLASEGLSLRLGLSTALSSGPTITTLSRICPHSDLQWSSSLSGKPVVFFYMVLVYVKCEIIRSPQSAKNRIILN